MVKAGIVAKTRNHGLAEMPYAVDGKRVLGANKNE